MTTSGARRPIRWLGHRATRCASHPEPRTVWPFRVRAGALGAGLPYQDLWLSPGHSLCIDDMLFPTRALAHGDLVAQVEMDEITYWHVELDSHDILIANGAAAESYLDTGNKSAFDNAPGVVDIHPDFEPRSTADFCRPFVESGAALTRVRRRLFGTATAEPRRVADIHLLADGVPLYPLVSNNQLTFIVPTDAAEVRLMSPCVKPQEGADVRTLGVLVSAIVLDAGQGPKPIALDDPALFAGFHDIERSPAGNWRWTDGNAHLSRDLWADATGDAVALTFAGVFARPEHAAPAATLAA